MEATSSLDKGRGWALVTGASSGLGIAFARSLAQRGYNIVLCARRTAALEQLAEVLRNSFQMKTAIETADLAVPGAAVALADRLSARGIHPEVLINNAGVGLAGDLMDQDEARLHKMLQLNVVALTELSQIFGRAMIERGRGRILLVASLAAFQPTPRLAAYGATKSYILSLGEALHVELAPKITVTVLSPGLMDTEFSNEAGFVITPSMRSGIMATEEVAELGLDALFAGRPSIVAGTMNRLMSLSSRLFSRHLAAKMVLRMSK